MPNPLFNRFNQGQVSKPVNNSVQPIQNGPLSGFNNLIQQFNQFKSTFQGDPRAQVQQLLDSGRMTQEQYNQFSNMAAQMRNMFR